MCWSSEVPTRLDVEKSYNGYFWRRVDVGKALDIAYAEKPHYLVDIVLFGYIAIGKDGTKHSFGEMPIVATNQWGKDVDLKSQSGAEWQPVTPPEGKS